MDTTNIGYSYHLPSGGWNYKIRNTLSQFSDLFSEFNKYIAPAYHHDRCERSVQMRVYSMHKGEFVMVFIAFFACFGLGVFIGLAGPSPTMTTSIPASTILSNTSSIYEGPFHLHSPALGTRVQQLWLMAEILTNNNDEEIFDKSFQISISVDGVLGDHNTVNLVPESEATNSQSLFRMRPMALAIGAHLAVCEGMANFRRQYVLAARGLIKSPTQHALLCGSWYNFYDVRNLLKTHRARELMLYDFYGALGEDLEKKRLLNLGTQHLKCKKQTCEEVMAIHLGALEYTRYILNINLYGLREFHKRYYIREIVFYFKTYNPAFTQMETWFRFIFLLTTFSIACWFAHTLRKFSTHDWAIEQKWLSILLPLLLLYNDPIFPLRLVSGSCFAPLMDTLFQSTFLAFVMLSWLALYHGLRQNERGFLSFYLIKVIVVGLVWTPAFIITIWQKYYAFYDPTFNYMMNPNYPVVKIMFFCAIILYFLYLLVLIVKAYSDLRNMPFFDIRLRCISIVVATVTFITTILALHGWGPAALQDHWASQPKVHYDTSAPFMALYGLFNFKLYILAYLFSPGGGNIHETAITKDNPAFSMINDSDEEVIYGSDEESRRPLNSHHRIANEEI